MLTELKRRIQIKRSQKDVTKSESDRKNPTMNARVKECCIGGACGKCAKTSSSLKNLGPLYQFASHFLAYLVQEFFEIDVRIQLPLLLVLVGAIIRGVACSTLVFFYPKTFIACILCTNLWIYWNPAYVTFVIVALSSPEAMAQAIVDVLGMMDEKSLRLAFLTLLLIPTCFEYRAFQFLAEIICEDLCLWKTSNISVIFLCVMVHAHLMMHLPARECIRRGMVALYGWALITTIVSFDMRRLPRVMGPFAYCGGVILLEISGGDNMELLAVSVRRAIRFSLRDVLEELGDDVKQDEMLHLAMLRWIVEFWSTTTSRADGVDASTSKQSLVADQLRGLKWNDLFHMLTVTTKQMRFEAKSLRTRMRSKASNLTQSVANHSFADLESMLVSFDLDAHAKPAVMAYKRAVYGFPPDRNVAIIHAFIRRCPVILLIGDICYFISSQSLNFVALLVPFAIYEVIRVNNWWCSLSDRLSSSIDGHNEYTLWDNIDSMAVLLSADKGSDQATALKVWKNVSSSVSALEMGLTAARCAQISAVASEFANDIISLTSFGMEISKGRWFYGARVAFREFRAIRRSSGGSPPEEAKCTNAAIRIIRNSKRLSRDVRVLVQEESHTLRPVFDASKSFVRKCWFWSSRQNESLSCSSTLTVEDHQETLPGRNPAAAM